MEKIMSIEEMVASVAGPDPVVTIEAVITPEAAAVEMDMHEFALLSAEVGNEFATVEAQINMLAMDVAMGDDTSAEGAKELGKRFVEWVKSIIATIGQAISKLIEAIKAFGQKLLSKEDELGDVEVTDADIAEVMKSETSGIANVSKTLKGSAGMYEMLVSLNKVSQSYGSACLADAKTLLSTGKGVTMEETTAKFANITNAYKTLFKVPGVGDKTAIEKPEVSHADVTGFNKGKKLRKQFSDQVVKTNVDIKRNVEALKTLIETHDRAGKEFVGESRAIITAMIKNLQKILVAVRVSIYGKYVAGAVAVLKIVTIVKRKKVGGKKVKVKVGNAADLK